MIIALITTKVPKKSLEYEKSITDLPAENVRKKSNEKTSFEKKITRILILHIKATVKAKVKTNFSLTEKQS